MHRTKIGLVAAIVLLALTAGIYSVVTRELKDSVVREVDADVSRAQRMHSDVARLESMEFASLVGGLAHRPHVVGVFDKSDEAGRRSAAFEQCEQLTSFLRTGGASSPDIVAIIDSTGKVLARNLNPDAMYGEDLRAKYPAVGTALRGEAIKDVWTLGNRMTRVAVAPIVQPDGTLRGALLVGYVVTARDARAKHDLLGAEIAYFHNGKVHTSSFIAEGTGETAKEDGNKIQPLNQVLFLGESWGQKALAAGAPTEVFHVVLDGIEYAAVAAPLHGNAFDKTSGVVTLESISDALEPASSVGIKLVGFGVLSLLVLLGALVLTSLRFVKPLDKIELGVAEIINGNIDYQFRPVGPDFEGLSNGLNVMLARLLGREEPNEDEPEEEQDESARWRSDQMLVEEGAGPGSGGGSAEAAALGQESEPVYFTRIFNEYVAALKAQGRPTKGITIQAFTAKLRLIEGGLKQKWKGCRMVRFKVNTQGAEVTLKPVPIT